MQKVLILQEELALFNDVENSENYKKLDIGFNKCKRDIDSIQPISVQAGHQKENIVNKIKHSYNILRDKSKQRGKFSLIKSIHGHSFSLQKVSKSRLLNKSYPKC